MTAGLLNQPGGWNAPGVDAEPNGEAALPQRVDQHQRVRAITTSVISFSWLVPPAEKRRSPDPNGERRLPERHKHAKGRRTSRRPCCNARTLQSQ